MTKETMHEAFSIEYHAHKQTQNNLKIAVKRAKALEYDRDMFERKYFSMLTSKYLGTPKEDMEIFYKQDHQIVWLGGDGFMGMSKLDGKIFIAFMYSENRKQFKKAYNLLLHKDVYYQPIDDKDYFHNHSTPYKNVRKLTIGARKWER